MQINKNDIFNVKIEKFSNHGLGIAKIDGMVLFVEQSCPGDELEVKVTHVTKNFAYAKINKIITPSTHRIKPMCEIQNVCGSCQLQFIDYEYQLQLKKEIVEDALHTIGNIDIKVNDTIASPETTEYRCKAQYPVVENKKTKELEIGYFRKNSHDIVDVHNCSLQPKICDEIIDFIRKNAKEYKISGYNEEKHKGILRHVVIRYSKTNNNCLVTLVVNKDKCNPALMKFGKAIFNKFEQVVGICLNYNTAKTNVIMSDKTHNIVEMNFIEETILGKTFTIDANSFFQVNPKCAEKLFAFVRDYVKDNFEKPILLDAYSGVSTFGILLSDVCEHVVSFDECKDAICRAFDAKINNDVENLEIKYAQAKDFFKSEIENNSKGYTVSVVDPPRKGMAEKDIDALLSLTSDAVIYVSCNPATLARDLKYMTSKGAKIKLVQPIDMFCHTYHVETVVVIDVKDVNK